ncbi:MAG: DUF3806 domain-containing protein [Agarilytica sp.]
MEQLISAPDEEWIGYITKMWALGNQICEDITEQTLDGSIDDLDRLQKIVDSGQIPVEETLDLQTLGIALGRVFVNETPDYDWWVVEDEHGKDACLRYKETNLLVFPQTIISKRIEDGDNVKVKALFLNLQKDLEEARKKNFDSI